jgi:hypothetical protein
MKKFIKLLLFVAGVVSVPGTLSSTILCKDPAVSDGGPYTCPFITNIDTNGTTYFPVGSCSYSENCCTSSGDGMNSWSVTGPWGVGGISITVVGDSRCSTAGGTYATTGNPSTESGNYCWCRIRRDTGSLGAWLYCLSYSADCASYCAYYCAYFTQSHSDFRAALCVVPD